MPGIFGVVDTARGSAPLQAELAAAAQAMGQAMRFDADYGISLRSVAGVTAVVGVVTLARAREDAAAAGGPTVVVLTGEAVPDAPASTADDVAVQLMGQKLDTAEVVKAIAGRWSGFVGDSRTNTCLLFNDRYGRERLFVHQQGTRTYFASEAKAILAAVPATRAFDPTGLAELLACGCTISGSSLFRDIEVLPPATELAFGAGSVRRRQFFEPRELESLSAVEAGIFLEAFPQSLRASVAQAVAAAPRIAVSLTGGLDSRMILASLDVPKGSVPCYTFGSMFQTTGDVAIARRIAADCGQPHEVVELGRGFVERAGDYLTRSVYIADGYLGLSGAGELYVNEQARAIAPTRMTGNWGGELMRGVRAFKCVVPKGDFLVPELSSRIGEAAARFSTPVGNPLSAALFQQIPYQGFARYAIERSQLTMRSPFLDDDVVRWLYRAPAQLRASVTAVEAVLRRHPSLMSIPTDAGSLGRASKVRKAWRKAIIKAEYLTSHGAPDWLARLSAAMPAPLLERRFLGVDKFQHFRYWTRRELSGLVRDVLAPARMAILGEWFDADRVRTMVDDHIAGRANYTDEIDRLMMIATAQAVLLERGPLPRASR